MVPTQTTYSNDKKTVIMNNTGFHYTVLLCHVMSHIILNL